MLVTFDAKEPRLVISQIPPGTTKVRFSMPAIEFEGVPDETGTLTIGNLTMNLVGEIEAIEETEVITQEPEIGEDGKVKQDKNGKTLMKQVKTKEKKSKEKRALDLKLL